MIKTRLFHFAARSAATAAANLLFIATSMAASISVENARAPATAAGMPNGVVYMTVVNNGAKAVRLQSLTTPAAAKAEMHSMSMDGGIMRMRPVTGGVQVPAGGTADFAPGGQHVMLIGLSEPLIAGKTFSLQLSFAGGEKLNVEVKIEASPVSGHSHH